MAARKSRRPLIETLALGIGAIIAALHSGGNKVSAETAGKDPVRCEIQVTSLGGGVELQGIVFANADVKGVYALQVSSTGSGQSNISQGGQFSARPDAPAKLGTVRLGGDSSTYEAKLKVTWNGQEVECVKKVGGGWL
jgi:curli production assembly/transport CsgH protein